MCKYSGMHSFINKYLLCICYMPGTALDAEDAEVTKTDHVLDHINFVELNDLKFLRRTIKANKTNTWTNCNANSKKKKSFENWLDLPLKVQGSDWDTSLVMTYTSKSRRQAQESNLWQEDNWVAKMSSNKYSPCYPVKVLKTLGNTFYLQEKQGSNSRFSNS